MNHRISVAASALLLLVGAGAGQVLQGQALQGQAPLDEAKLAKAMAVALKEIHYEFLAESEPDKERLAELSKDGWDYAGVYGISDLGTNVSLTLWKRPLTK